MTRPLKNRWRFLTLAGYFAVLIIVVVAISQLYLYLNTGADRSLLLKVSADFTAAHEPLISWDTSLVKGRIISPLALASVEKDYKMAWHAKALALEVNDSTLLSDYYTTKAKHKIAENIAFNDSLKNYVRSTSLSHDLILKLYSEDGQLVVLTDTAAVEHRRTYKNKQLIDEVTDVSTYEIMMLLEDGNWRIRHMVLKDRKPVSKMSPVNAGFVENWRGINYYPQATPWDTFGENFNIDIIKQDFKLLQDNGINSIRIFLGYEDFGKEFLNLKKIEKLRLLLDAAEVSNLEVMVTLFDFYGDYDLKDWSFTQKHAVDVISALKDHSAIRTWDIKNEPDLDYKNRNKYRVESWLKQMIHTVKKEDPNRPVTIGWSTIEAARNLKEEVDFVSFHYYDDPDQFSNETKTLKTESGNKPILLSEYGLSSHTGWWQFFTNGMQQQAEYHKQMSAQIRASKIGAQVWTLYDFPEIPEDVFDGSSYENNLQKNYGFINENGESKKSFKFMIKQPLH